MTWITVEAFASNRPNKNYVNTKCGRSGCVFRSIRQAKYLPIHRFKVVVVWLSLGNTIGGTTRGLDAGCIVLVVGSEWGTGTLPPRLASPRLPQSPCVRRVTVIISTTERFIDLLCHFPDEKDKYVATPAMCVFADMYQQPTAQMDRLRARVMCTYYYIPTYFYLHATMGTVLLLDRVTSPHLFYLAGRPMNNLLLDTMYTCLSPSSVLPSRSTCFVLSDSDSSLVRANGTLLMG